MNKTNYKQHSRFNLLTEISFNIIHLSTVNIIAHRFQWTYFQKFHLNARKSLLKKSLKIPPDAWTSIKNIELQKKRRQLNTHCKHCMFITVKFMRVMLSKFSKINLSNLSNRGRAPGAPALNPPLLTTCMHGLGTTDIVRIYFLGKDKLWTVPIFTITALKLCK